ncbi:VOC family protein [Paenibacillus sp. MZ04-78.2]|uniref:VOC family protein n=1 Tax=Paenibacillus sp. MZ04-78.2 TaxID=2962034 RepID=UPI0020B8C37F|nr:VOC family protein [Paenibacillus sp. MZ04-78.2]MCP3773771.1 VOC family protein [Paenibacillus sp. MZ04-78.2]
MKIREVILHSSNYEATKQFYCDTFQLPVLEENADSLVIQAGESKLTFVADDREQAYYHIAFTIPDNKADEALEWVRSKGIEPIAKDDAAQFPSTNWNSTALYFHDPDGNLVELIAHHSLSNATSEPFSSKHILRMSEIGLPVEDLPAALRQLHESFSLEKWSGDGQRFAAVGNVEGLLIVIDHKRPWFPDERMPGIFPTTVKLQTERAGRIELGPKPYRIESVS